MTWRRDDPQGDENSKIATLTVPYLQGKCLDIGCGPTKVWPSLIGIDSCKDYGGQRPQAVDIVCNGEDLSLFANKTIDGIFSSHFLEHVMDYKKCLAEWWRVIKVDGYLVLYLPHKKFYPNIGAEGSNPDHKHDFMPDDIIEAMKEVGSWELLENEDRDKGYEYSFYQVYKKLPDRGKNKHVFKVWERNPNGLKRCIIHRYGAIGDQIITSSILPALKKQGYYITYNTDDRGREILAHDPNIDEFWYQGKDFVPNVQLGPYWDTIRMEGRYDKIINLCESIEGALLTLPGRLQNTYTDDTRRKLFGTVNYLERTHDIADVPYEFSSKFYMTAEEKIWAKKQIKDINVPVIAWALNGSAHHKVYPWVQIVIAWLLERTPCHIFLTGDKEFGKGLEDGIVNVLKEDGKDLTNLHCASGKWTAREALSFMHYVDCVVGPETGPLNAVSLEKDIGKVIYLSHSSHENLTKHWENTVVLEPDREKAPCFPCHRLQYGWDYCHQDNETKASLCASAISPKRVFDAIINSLGLSTVPKPESLLKVGVK